MDEKYHIVGLCVCMMHDDYYDKMIRAFCKAAENSNIKFLIFGGYHSLNFIDENRDCSGAIFQLIPYDKLEGIVIFGESIKNEKICKTILSRATSQGLPVVSVDYPLPGAYNIRFGYADVFEQLVRHMVEHHGYRRINLIAGVKGNPFEQERTNAYRKVLTEYGIPVEEERIAYGDFWTDPTFEAIDSFVESDLPFPEAIVCENDTMALAACKRLEDHCISVPDQVAVSGLDGISAAMNNSPSITTAIQNVAAAADATMELLTGIFERTDRHGIDEEILIPFTPVYQTSCGCRGGNGSIAGDLIDAFKKWDRALGNDIFVDKMKDAAIGCESLSDLRDKLMYYQQNNNWKCVRSDFPVKKEYMQAEELQQLRKVDEFDFDRPAFTGHMKMFLRMTPSEDYQLEDEFPTALLLPGLDTILERVKHLIFIPLYFGNTPFGYEAIEFASDSYVEFDFERRFCNTYNLLLKILQDDAQMHLVMDALQRKNEQLNELFEQDYLTKLYNRGGFVTRIERLRRMAGRNESLVVLSLDMDGLKHINDTYGHKEGDYALKQVAAALRKVQETYLDMLCARFGGDEFAAAGYFPGPESEEVAAESRNIFYAELKRLNEAGGKAFQVDASMGCRIIPVRQLTSVENAINDADHKMYEEKEQKKHGISSLH